MTLARLADYFDVLRNLGTIETIHFTLQRARENIAPPELLVVRSRFARYPLYCRRGTSDREAFGQIFSHREYRCLDHVQRAELIIDCGANVGFSSAYFLSRFPLGHVIAVEPDGCNCIALRRNLAPYGARVRLVQAGVWPRAVGLKVIDASCGDGKEWARGVRECLPHETPDVSAVDIGTLLDESGHSRINILKIDIEGSEQAVFEAPTPWLERVDHLVIETHGSDCEAAVRRATAAAGFSVSRFNNELLVGRHG
jgi:FkbM family methyltransferase